MSLDEERAGWLEAFLSARRVPHAELVAAVGEHFGRPLLVVATGSILQGFGNQRSDVDIYAVVEHDVSRMPVPSYAHRFLVHHVYFGAPEVESWIDAIRDHPWPPTGRITQEQWGRRRVELGYCTNFSCGLLLEAREGWGGWLGRLRESWLVSRVVQWWRIEAARRQLAGRWLADAKPLLAAQRHFEAVLAILESRAAAGGQLYFGPKWVSEKLRATNDADGLQALRAVMRAPTTQLEARKYMAECEGLVERLGGEAARGLNAQVWYLSGVQVRELDVGAIVSRWNLGGVELRRDAVAVPPPNELFWEGGVDVSPPVDVVSLMVGGMAWVSIVATTA